MESLTRLVSESLARHGFDRPLDYRRLHWSRWFRCESVHSLLFVPSKPGVFAIAEEVIDFGTSNAPAARNAHVVTAVPRPEASRPTVEERRFSAASSEQKVPALAAAGHGRRMLAVTQFFEDDDMAFILDRMLSQQNPLRARLTSGRYFIRFVTIEDQSQRRSICAALNQWIADSAEKVSAIGSHFATSLELTPATEYVAQGNDSQQSLFGDASVGRTLLSATAHSTDTHVETAASAVPRTLSEAQGSGPAEYPGFPHTFSATATHLDSGAASNIHCPSPLPSGF
jgi:hypothetical protein